MLLCCHQLLAKLHAITTKYGSFCFRSCFQVATGDTRPFANSTKLLSMRSVRSLGKALSWGRAAACDLNSFSTLRTLSHSCRAWVVLSMLQVAK